MNKAAPLLLLAVALGVAGYFALDAGDSGSTSDATVGMSQSGAAEDVGVSNEGPEVLAAPEIELENGDRKVMSLGAGVRPSPAPPQVPQDDAAARGHGRGSVTGRVTDGDGVPLAGASVDIVRRDLGDLFTGGRPGHEASVTDGDGRFTIQTRTGALRLTVEADGFAPYSVSVAVTSDATEDVGELRLAPGVILRGRVVDADGNGIAGASLARVPQSSDGITILGGEGDQVAQTDGGGDFVILRQGPGAYRFDVSHPEFPPAVLAGKTEQAGETVSDLRVVMDPGGMIRGVAVGLPAGTANLFAEAVPGEAPNEGFTFSSGPGKGRSAPIQSDGTFELRGLVRGLQYQIHLREGEGTFMNGNRRSSSIGAMVPKQGVGTLVQVPFSLGASVRFTVLDETGAPHVPDRIEAGFQFTFQRDDVEIDEATGLCNVGGLWPAADGQVLELVLVAKGFKKWEAKGLMVYPGDQVDLGRITLKARPSVRVTVVDDGTGEPVEGASVTLAPPPEDEASGGVRISASLGDDHDGLPEFDRDAVKRGKTDADGVCDLDASAGAAVVLTVHDSIHASVEIGPFTLPETMVVFEQEVRLAQGGGLRIVAFDPNGTPARGYTVEFQDEQREDHDRDLQRTGDDGVLEITGMRTGEHLIRLGGRATSSVFMARISLPGMGEPKEDEAIWTSVTVLPGEIEDVTLAAPAIGELTGIVAERGEKLGSARLKLRKANDDNPLAGLMMLGGSGSPSATSDAHGEFRLANVEAGDYELVVEHSTRAMPFTMPITIEGGEQELELDLSVTEVTGRVLDEHGEPLAGAKVEAKRAPKEGGSGRRAVSMVMLTSNTGGGAAVMMTTGEDEVEATTTDAEGRYRLRGVTSGIDLEVRATAKGYDVVKSEPFRVSDGGIESDVDLRFTKAGSIRIEIEGGTGPLMALLRRRGARRSAPPKIEMLKPDSTTIDSLSPGTWTVTLQPAAGGALSSDPNEVEVEVVGGETAVASFKIL